MKTPDTWDWTETLWVILRGMSTEKKNEVMNLISLILQEKTQRDIERLEALKQENNYSTAYGDWTPERAIEEEAKTQGYNLAITDCLAALKETK